MLEIWNKITKHRLSSLKNLNVCKILEIFTVAETTKSQLENICQPLTSETPWNYLLKS